MECKAKPELPIRQFLSTRDDCREDETLPEFERMCVRLRDEAMEDRELLILVDSMNGFNFMKNVSTLSSVIPREICGLLLERVKKSSDLVLASCIATFLLKVSMISEELSSGIRAEHIVSFLDGVFERATVHTPIVLYIYGNLLSVGNVASGKIVSKRWQFALDVIERGSNEDVMRGFTFVQRALDLKLVKARRMNELTDVIVDVLNRSIPSQFIHEACWCLCRMVEIDRMRVFALGQTKLIISVWNEYLCRDWSDLDAAFDEHPLSSVLIVYQTLMYYPECSQQLVYFQDTVFKRLIDLVMVDDPILKQRAIKAVAIAVENVEEAPFYSRDSVAVIVGQYSENDNFETKLCIGACITSLLLVSKVEPEEILFIISSEAFHFTVENSEGFPSWIILNLRRGLDVSAAKLSAVGRSNDFDEVTSFATLARLRESVSDA